MRTRTSENGLTVQAIAGNHAVFLGLDLDQDERAGCLGFAIERADLTEGEQYWLSSFKTFRSVVPVPDPNGSYSTRDHPLQTFYWGDYTAKPGHRYRYRVVARNGTPKSLTDGAESTIDVQTSDPTQGTHGVYFNRGVAASQAYERKFGLPPSQLPPDKQAEALVWLSRGLIEAMLAFIAQADGPGSALRAAVYEFTQPDVLAAFKAAHDAGADVKIVYHARADTEGRSNKAAIEDAGLPAEILVERTNSPIAHNKFIVHATKDAAGSLGARSVWTGSTNLSQGGIYGHSNVGHVVRDPDTAAAYLGLWAQLGTDPLLDDARDWISEHSPFDEAQLAPTGTHTLYSPRHGLDPLNWYAGRFGNPDGLAMITEAFGVTTVIEDALEEYAGQALHYLTLDKPDSNQAQWGNSNHIFVAVGALGGPSTLSRWAQEQLTGFNPMVPYLHTKILLLDPLSATPTVISGSANFSPNSTNRNDENMLVIVDDTETADVYFTEYARIFNHFYARYWASRLGQGGSHAADSSFLQETDDWQQPYFTAGNPKQLQRTLYSTSVQGNT